MTQWMKLLFRRVLVSGNREKPMKDMGYIRRRTTTINSNHVKSKKETINCQPHFHFAPNQKWLSILPNMSGSRWPVCLSYSQPVIVICYVFRTHFFFGWMMLFPFSNETILVVKWEWPVFPFIDCLAELHLRPNTSNPWYLLETDCVL